MAAGAITNEQSERPKGRDALCAYKKKMAILEWLITPALKSLCIISYPAMEPTQIILYQNLVLDICP